MPANDTTTPLTNKWGRMHEDARQGLYGELSPRLVELLDELEATMEKINLLEKELKEALSRS